LYFNPPNTFNSLPFAIPQSGTVEIQLGVDVVDVPFHDARHYTAFEERFWCDRSSKISLAFERRCLYLFDEAIYHIREFTFS
jgi:hypothetical protein